MEKENSQDKTAEREGHAAEPGVPPPRLTVSHECVLRGASSAVLATLRAALTIDNPKYQDAKRYGRWVGKQLKPHLFFFREEEGEIFFPRGFGNEAVRFCRRKMSVTPEIADLRRSLKEADLSFQGTLRPYQEQAVSAVLAHSFGVLEAGTGSGKTVMALAVIARRRQPTLILVHSRELLHQWRAQIQHFLGVEAGQAGDGVLDIRLVTVAIVNTAKKHLEELVPAFGHLVADECHRVPASLFTEVVSAFDSRYMLGLSATAFRREDGMTRLIYIFMGERVHAVNAHLLTASGAVLRPRLSQRATSFACAYRGDYASLLKKLAADPGRNRQIADDIEGLLAKGHRGTVLLVSDRVAHCRELARLLAERGLAASVLTGQTAPEERTEIVERVRAGQVQLLIATVQLIGEGFDCPGLATLVLATPIKFEGRLLQVVGRIMRPEDGKEPLVIDYADEALPVLRRSAAHRRAIFAAWQG